MGLRVDWNRRTTQWTALLLASCAQAQPVQAPPPQDVAEAALSSIEASRYVDAPVWAAGERKAFTALLVGSH